MRGQWIGCVEREEGSGYELWEVAALASRCDSEGAVRGCRWHDVGDMREAMWATFRSAVRQEPLGRWYGGEC